MVKPADLRVLADALASYDAKAADILRGVADDVDRLRAALAKCQNIATDYLVRGHYQDQLYRIQGVCVTTLNPGTSHPAVDGFAQQPPPCTKNPAAAQKLNA